MAKVSDGIRNMGKTPLGYIWVFSYKANGEGFQRTLDTYNAQELIDLTKQDIIAKFKIGEYYYLIVEYFESN